LQIPFHAYFNINHDIKFETVKLQLLDTFRMIILSSLKLLFYFCISWIIFRLHYKIHSL